MSKQLLILLCFTFVSFSQSSPQKSLNAGADIRLRYEHADGYNYKGYGPAAKWGETDDDYVLSNIKIYSTYRHNEFFTAKILLQDSRALGWSVENEAYQSKEFGLENNPHKDFLELKEAYLESRFPSLHSTVKLGRQTISIGDERIFGAARWKNSSKWLWDGALITVGSKSYSARLFGGKTVLNMPETNSFAHRYGYTGAAAYGHLAPFAWLSFEPFIAYKRNSDGEKSYNSRDHFYTGLHLGSEKGITGMTYELIGVMQNGEQEDTTGSERNINAFGAVAGAGYQLSIPTKPAISVEYAYASGDNGTTAEIETFDGVYGGAFKFYGRMGIVNWSNLHQGKFSLNLKPAKKAKVTIEYHLFYLAEEVSKWKGNNISIRSSKHIGNELDLVARYLPYKYLELFTGGGYFLNGKLIKDNRISDSNAWWLFFQTTWSFDLQRES